MIERLKEIRSKFKPENNADIHADSLRALDELLDELEAKEAAQTPVKGQLFFHEWGDSLEVIDTKIVDLENVIIHEESLSNGRKWYAISGILIDEE